MRWEIGRVRREIALQWRYAQAGDERGGTALIYGLVVVSFLVIGGC